MPRASTHCDNLGIPPKNISKQNKLRPSTNWHHQKPEKVFRLTSSSRPITTGDQHSLIVSDVDRVERFRLTLRFFDDVSRFFPRRRTLFPNDSGTALELSPISGYCGQCCLGNVAPNNL